MNILIIEVNWLGDVLFSTPAIKALRKKFPDRLGRGGRDAGE